ncbi:MAG: hypothetical protein ACTSQY_00095 [Candidatus Odinarchaeia archaeon]|nr:MAG: hypothetical protein [Lokiarchaeota virus Fenrir Meg22_1012]URC17198.1 MAG: hypothetical protein [Lokiarchaeota virus Fenrir Meg22_1214]
MAISGEFLRWEVKPIWKISYPSSLLGDVSGTVTIFGVDRGSLDVSRNWEKINSVEEFNQGFVAKPTDFTITIAVKERGEGFETLRRLSSAGTLFDIECDLLRETDNTTIVGDRSEEDGIQGSNYEPWLKGFESYLGCVVNREGSTVEIATFPIREFECIFLRRTIRKYDSLLKITEGAGTTTNFSEIGL